MVMTGFWKNHQPIPETLDEWLRGLGTQFDPSGFARLLKDAGVGCLYFFDKWGDGLVWHDTITTNFHTERDFVREVADACHAQGLPLGFVTEPLWEDNPEFAQFVTRDADGNPYAPLPGVWVARFFSVHSPYRVLCLEQIRELLRDYGPVACMWLDTFSNPWPAWRGPWTDQYSEHAFLKRYGIPIRSAPPELFQQFVLETVAGFCQEITRVATELQPDVTFTMNQSVLSSMTMPRIATNVHSPLTYFSIEGHSIPALENDSAAASFLRRPMEIGFWISSDMFIPPGDPSPTRMREAVAACALAWSQGANVWFGINPQYDGTYGGEKGAITEAGQWLEARRDVLRGTIPWRDVGVVLGAPAPTIGVFPELSELWQPAADVPGVYKAENLPSSVSGVYYPEPVLPTSFIERQAWGEALRMHLNLRNLGYGSEILYSLADLAAWPDDLSQFPALVVPERACLDEEHMARLREYVKAGGQLLVFGHGSLLGPEGGLGNEFALADVLGLHFVGQAKCPGDENRVTCTADSEFYQEFDWGAGNVVANLIDGTAAAWVSMETPMPHWCQVNLPADPLIGKVRVTAKDGGYVLRDFQVLFWTGDGWQQVKLFGNNRGQAAEVTLDPPQKTRAVRILVTKAFLGPYGWRSTDRMAADIKEVELFAPDGTLLTTQKPDALQTAIAGEELKKRLPGESPLTGPALIVEPRGAEVLATFADPVGGEARPLVTRHQFGAGTAYWVAVSEGFIPDGSPWWPALASLAAGSPGVTWDNPARHRVILRRSGDALLICASDAQVGLAPEPLRLRLHLQRLGLRGEVEEWADGKAARVQKIGEDLELEITPDPAVTLLVR